MVADVSCIPEIYDLYKKKMFFKISPFFLNFWQSDQIIRLNIAANLTSGSSIMLGMKGQVKHIALWRTELHSLICCILLICVNSRRSSGYFILKK